MRQKKAHGWGTQPFGEGQRGFIYGRNAASESRAAQDDSNCIAANF